MRLQDCEVAFTSWPAFLSTSTMLSNNTPPTHKNNIWDREVLDLPWHITLNWILRTPRHADGAHHCHSWCSTLSLMYRSVALPKSFMLEFYLQLHVTGPKYSKGTISHTTTAIENYMVMDGWNTATCILYNRGSACFFASIQLSNIYIKTQWAGQLSQQRAKTDS